MKKTGSSKNESWCEIESCMDSLRAASRGNLPGFECEHLRSVQHAEPYVEQTPLEMDTLNAMVTEHKWLSESRKKECMELNGSAKSKGTCPVYPWLPQKHLSQRFIHYSVYSNKKHYWCKFSRCIVTFDTLDGVWMCACSPAKRPCVHKAMARWFTLQSLPEKFQLNVSAAISDDTQSVVSTGCT